jgi:ribonuclease D
MPSSAEFSQPRICPPLIQEATALQAMVDDLRQSEVIGVDAEMDSIHGYTAKLCLIQISTSTSDYLLDPLVADLNLDELGKVLSSEIPVKVFHAAENDIPFLKERIGGELQGLFDTYLAARILGFPRSGLSALLEEYFGIHQDKRFQTADWRTRPLPADQDEYARVDTRHLLQLREILVARLDEGDCWDEALGEFRRACRAKLARKPFDPDGWAKVSGARWLSPRDKAALKALYIWRDAQARVRDVALFRVLPDKLLIGLAQTKSWEADKLRETFHHPVVQRHAAELSVLLQEAQRQPQARIPARPLGQPTLTREQHALYEAIKKWRNTTSQSTSLEPDRIFSNRTLKAIAQAAPQTWEQLSQLESIEAWQIRRYGEALWQEIEKALSPPSNELRRESDG